MEWKKRQGIHKLTLPVGTIEIRWRDGSWRTYYNNQNLHLNGLNTNNLKRQSLEKVGDYILRSVDIIDELLEENNENL
jgi:hypothetical protein